MKIMKLISIIVPTYNEEKNISLFVSSFRPVFDSLKSKYSFEMLFINDGSNDNTLSEIYSVIDNNPDIDIKVIDFSRNFGKEIALTAGLNMCSGSCAIMIDADLQHPIELIPEFINKWESGYDVVVGIRKTNKDDSVIKKIGSYIFNKIVSKISSVDYTSRSTDYRLIDRAVIDEFNKLKEGNRMTRGLIDWLGFKKGYIFFDAKPRANGERSYSIKKLFRLFVNGIIQNSLFPLKLAGYLGGAITLVSGVFGLCIIIGRYIVKNSWWQSISHNVILGVLNMFLIGIVLSCLGLIALYIADISNESKNRPLYVINKKTSRKI
mgnify:CR=1 FL=1